MAIPYPKYYRKDGRAIKRETDTTGITVEIPATAQAKLPLILAPVVYPEKERFDEAIIKMDIIDQEIFENYVKHFCGRVYTDIDKPLTDRQLASRKPANP